MRRGGDCASATSRLQPTQPEPPTIDLQSASTYATIPMTGINTDFPRSRTPSRNLIHQL